MVHAVDVDGIVIGAYIIDEITEGYKLDGLSIKLFCPVIDVGRTVTRVAVSDGITGGGKRGNHTNRPLGP